MTEIELNAEIEKQRALYRDNVATNPSTATAASEQVKVLLAELSALLSKGARPCEVCGAQPHGMKRRPHVYEVGCLNCQGIQSFGGTAAEAVENWNNGLRNLTLAVWLSM